MSSSTSFFADTPVGRLVNQVSSGSLLRKPDQVQGFQLPSSLSLTRQGSKSDETTLAGIESEKATPTKKSTPHSLVSQGGDVESNQQLGEEVSRVLSSILPDGTRGTHAESNEKEVVAPASTSDSTIVGWYGDDDAENPVNWSKARKILVTVCICILTFSVYAGSSIATPGIPGMIEEFNISITQGVMTLSVFIMGYATGSLILSPLSDMPSVGRSTPYWTSMLALVLFNVGAAHAKSYGTHITMRLLAGMAGSPALATGGATLGDVWQGLALPKAISIWAIGAVCGPVLAPVIAGWSAQNVSWRLPLYIFVAMSGLGLLVVLFLLPETSASNILYRRAQRLRKLTGNDKMKSQGEVDEAAVGKLRFIEHKLYMPLRISIEPIVLYSSVLLGLIYAIFYCAFESVPIIYGEIHHFNIGEQTLPFLALGFFGLVGLFIYLAYLTYWFDPRFIRKASKGIIDPEDRVILALITAPLVLLSLLWTGWTAKPNISYWSPLIAQGIYVIPVFYLFQAILTYLAFAYMEHQASVMAANNIIRSLIASAFPIFARPLFLNLGLGKGYTLLAGLSLALMLPLWGLFKYGHVLRKHSKFAHVY
jgi:DHA1 family multidrug resistance protein-like MFS transporter